MKGTQIFIIFDLGYYYTVVSWCKVNLSIFHIFSQAANASDEPRVLCIVRDMTNTEVQSKFTMNLPASTIIRDFIQEVATKCGYENDTFLLSYERPDGGELAEVRCSAIKFCGCKCGLFEIFANF